MLATYSLGVVLSAATTDYFYLAMLPMFAYEVSVGLWLLVKGGHRPSGAA